MVYLLLMEWSLFSGVEIRFCLLCTMCKLVDISESREANLLKFFNGDVFLHPFSSIDQIVVSKEDHQYYDFLTF